MGIVFDRPIMMKKQFGIRLLFIFLFIGYGAIAQTPDSFLTHKVKKGETIEWITERYQITAEQLNAFNTSLARFGIRRKMNLRIPVFSTVVVKPERSLTSIKKDTTTYRIHEVLSQETKWRLA